MEKKHDKNKEKQDKNEKRELMLQKKKENKERKEKEKLAKKEKKEKERLAKKEKKENKANKERKNKKKKEVIPPQDGDKKKKRKKPRRKWWKKLISFFLFCGCLAVFAVFGFCIYIVSTCGEFDPNALANQDQTIIYDSQGNIIAKLGMEKRESVTYDELPEVLIDAIVATEDSRYFEHNGVDGARFLKASVGQILGNSSAGGASTLTMQVVKNNLTSTEQTITRKFKDIYIAVFFMEEKYTKKEILEFYVNDSYLGGSNVYGVEEASKYYFGKSVSQLSLPEASLIAGLFQAPSGYNPYNYPEKAAKRRSTVLKLMVKHGYITQEEADIANSVDVTSMLVGNNKNTQYQGYIDTVVAEVKNKTKLDPAVVSMEIYTTMDPSIQNGIDGILAGNGYAWKDDKVQAGISIVDVNTGAITAIGTGRNRTGERQWNYATQTYRQPGSTAKPIFAYAPGFEFDNFSTYQLFVDEEWTYTDGTRLGNWDGAYDGLMTLRRALSISRNIPALKAFQTVQSDVGNKKIVEFVEGLGINLKDNVAYESYSIGGLSSGVTTLQMAAAYAAFANGGYYTEPYTVKSITYRDTGETVDFEAKRTKAMKDSTAYLVTNVLEYAAHYGFSGGTGSYRGTVAVKTGTSNYDDATLKAHGLPSYAVNDLWSVAYTPQYSIALWYGYDEISNQYFNSSGTPKDNLMAAIMRCIPVTTEPFKQPSSVVAAQVEAETWPAMKPSQYTLPSMIMTEYFISGTEPTEESPRFQKLQDVTNLKATVDGTKVKLTWEHKKPDVISEEYVRAYFNQPIWGNSADKFINQRIHFNNVDLGGLGYAIYVNKDGNLTRIGYTDELSYTYSSDSYGDISLVVKAQYTNYDVNASDGTSVKVEVKKPVNNNNDDDDNTDDNTENKLTIKLNDNKNFGATLGNYSDPNIVVTYNEKVVTNHAEITYVLTGSNNNKIGEYSSLKDLNNAVNSIEEAQAITVKYLVKYKTDEETLTGSITRFVILK